MFNNLKIKGKCQSTPSGNINFLSPHFDGQIGAQENCLKIEFWSASFKDLISKKKISEIQ
jgi:hypothetical protein